MLLKLIIWVTRYVFWLNIFFLCKLCKYYMPLKSSKKAFLRCKYCILILSWSDIQPCKEMFNLGELPITIIGLTYCIVSIVSKASIQSHAMVDSLKNCGLLLLESFRIFSVAACGSTTQPWTKNCNNHQILSTTPDLWSRQARKSFITS